MKQVITTSRNITQYFNDDKKEFKALVECVLVLNEPAYEMTYDGIRKTSKTETIRFTAHPDALRDIAKQFLGWAEEAEKQKIVETVAD